MNKKEKNEIVIDRIQSWEKHWNDKNFRRILKMIILFIIIKIPPAGFGNARNETNDAKR